MKILSCKFLFSAALFLLIAGGGMESTAGSSVVRCDGVTQATPPVRPARRDSTKTSKKKQAKKHKKDNTKTKKETRK